MNDVLARLKSVFPNLTITSGARDPNSPLGRANPRSYHNIGRAYDVRPIPGMSFDDFIGKVKGAGINVVEARDEVTNPSKHATGPHWHFAYGPTKAQPQMDLIRRAQAFNIDLPPAPGMGSMPVTQAATQPAPLPTLSNVIQAQAPQTHRKPNTLASILGILGDSLMAYGGLQPTFGPGLAQQRQDEEAMNFRREQFNAELAARREEALAKAQEPPQFIQNLDAYMRMPPEMKTQYLQYLDATQPIAVSGPQGTSRVPRTLPPQPGEVQDGYIFLGGDPSNPNSWRPQ